MPNQSKLIQTIQKWQIEWDQLIVDTENHSDQRTTQLLKSYKPQFQTLLRVLQTSIATQHQSDFFPDVSDVGRMNQLVDRIIKKINDLSLSPGKVSHARRRD